MNKKIMIIGTVILAAAAFGIYGFSEYNRKPANVNELKADIIVDHAEIIADYESDEQGSNTKYLDKVISITGNLKSVEVDESNNATLILGNESSVSSVRASMAASENEKIKSLSPGTKVAVKGICTGFNKDELLGSDVFLNRAVIISN